MEFEKQLELFEKTKKIHEKSKLVFKGVDGFDVYNPSIPFFWQGKEYIYGRVEKREKWAESKTYLFEKVKNDEWMVVPNSPIYSLEDPFVSVINDEIVLGGVDVKKENDEIVSFRTCFYRGVDINDLKYFFSGPEKMKDIRLVALNKKIGVFTRPKSDEIKIQYGCDSVIGFTTINSLSELNKKIIEKAPIIPNLFKSGEWGGCNQAILLSDNEIGVVGHKCYISENKEGGKISHYIIISFVFDIFNHIAKDLKIIGTRSCFPEGPAKKDWLIDCCFPAGVIDKNDDKVEVYSGINDCEVGKIVINKFFN